MLVFHLTAEDIEQFGSNALLTELVVFEVKLFEQLLGVVVGALHCHHTGGLLGGTVLGSVCASVKTFERTDEKGAY